MAEKEKRGKAQDEDVKNVSTPQQYQKPSSVNLKEGKTKFELWGKTCCAKKLQKEEVGLAIRN